MFRSLLAIRLCIFFNFFVIITLFSTLSLAAPEKKGGRPPPKVVVKQIKTQLVTPQIKVQGDVVALRVSRLSSQVSGLIVKVHVHPGDQVKKGDPLIELDQEEMRAEMRILAAEHLEARTRLKKTLDNLSREKKLSKNHALSKSRLENRQAEAAIQKAILIRAEARLDQIQQRLAWHRLSAPFSGTVISLFAQQGEWLENNKAAITLLDLESLEIEAPIHVRLAGQLKDGFKTVAYFQGVKSPLPLLLRAIIPQSSLKSRSVPSRWRILTKKLSPALKKTLLPGRATQILVPLNKLRKALIVPKDAVLYRGRQSQVFVVKDETVHAVEVKLGIPYKDGFVIKKGLVEGDWVVIRGNERLRAGQKVEHDIKPEIIKKPLKKLPEKIKKAPEEVSEKTSKKTSPSEEKSKKTEAVEEKQPLQPEQRSENVQEKKL
ncbi:efflux RND transporter periplasmic adaptor subunit [Magnetococcales bacterium HHB-1]